MTGIEALDRWLALTAGMPVPVLAFIAPIVVFCGGALLLGRLLRKRTALRVSRRAGLAAWMTYLVVLTIGVVSADTTISRWLVLPVLIWPLLMLSPLVDDVTPAR